MKIFKLLLAVLLLTDAARAVHVTVYNDNLGLIREEREFDLKRGSNELRITDVPSQIDATSVHFKSLTDPDGTKVLEQNFQYDLINQDKLLDRYIGKEVQFEYFKPNGDKQITKGTLLSSIGGRILRVGNQIYLNPPGNPILPDLPDGLVTRPTLLWNIRADKAGQQKCELTYLTEGMSWKADYVIVSNEKDDKMDLNAWVTLDNNSGAVYKDAKLKLVAGDINRAPAGRQDKHLYRTMEMAAAPAAAGGFAEKSFFEYHLYTLDRPTTLMNNETKQIELTRASDVPLKKKYVYDGVSGVQWAYYSDYVYTDPSYGTMSAKKVWVNLEFKNSKENNMGMPLPKGRVRVYKKDSDASLQLIGEDGIGHTPKDETVRIKMGQAFDIVGERKRIDFGVDNDKKTFRESFEIKIRNHKEEAVLVNVVEHLYRWTNWKITASSHSYKKKDAQTVEYEIPVPKDGETVVTYTVKYSW